MKLYNYCLIFLAVFLFISCEKETEDLSRSTYYVSFNLKGENPLLVPVGESFTDPGVIATEKGKDVTSSITVESDVDATVMGKYSIVYSSVNVDGLKSKAVREVYVCNPLVTTDISGTYTVQAGTHRIAFASGARVDYGGNSVTITRVAPGFFYVSDLFGVYYEKRPGYGPRYAMTGYIALNEDNTIDLVSSSVAAWGDSLDTIKDGVYNPVTGEISWKAEYVESYSFNVTLKK
ncbi:MAG: BT_2262 family domain-containing protein [Prolixibacteraceae bacterium]